MLWWNLLRPKQSFVQLHIHIYVRGVIVIWILTHFYHLYHSHTINISRKKFLWIMTIPTLTIPIYLALCFLVMCWTMNSTLYHSIFSTFFRVFFFLHFLSRYDWRISRLYAIKKICSVIFYKNLIVMGFNFITEQKFQRIHSSF